MTPQQIRVLNLALLAAALCGLAIGLIAQALGRPEIGRLAMFAGIVPVLAATVVETLRGLFRGEFGLDIIAVVSIAGAAALDQPLVAGVIGVMLSGGRALEDYAAARARRDMEALLSHVPRTARRFDGTELVDTPLEDVKPGDRLEVASGEAVATDGTAQTAVTLDEQALTGESVPVVRQPGETLRSGAVNAGEAFEMTATADAAASTFAGIVKLVEGAQASKAPSARLADRVAFIFTPLALGLAGVAWWMTGDSLRGLAVIVVATPCPLILGVPVAIVSGLSRCAGRGVLVKGGGTLELLAQARTLFLDKTGTLTAGQAELSGISVAEGVDENAVLAQAASLEQFSRHVTAQALVAAAHARGLTLSTPTDVVEEAGAGLSGTVGGSKVSVGSHDYVASRAPMPPWAAAIQSRAAREGATAAFVAADGAIRGALLLADAIREDAPRALRLLHRAGITRIVMLTGDREDTARAIGATLGIDDVRAGLQPQDKLAAIVAARAEGVCIMVGDGVNDAPALAAASIGVAMGGHGANGKGGGGSTGASSEAADIVLLSDRLDRLAEALAIARGTRRIAIQTVGVGMGLSLLAMIAAALGQLPPVAGALLQEVIDVAAILNALRVLGVAIPGRPARPLPAAEVARLRGAHQDLLAVLSRVLGVAEALPGLSPKDAMAALAEIEPVLRDTLLRHELDDDSVVYPVIEHAIGGDDPMGAMHHEHRTIQQLGHQLRATIEDAANGEIDHATALDMARLLIRLEAIARLHFAQEDEIYHALADSIAQPGIEPEPAAVKRGE